MLNFKNFKHEDNYLETQLEKYKELKQLRKNQIHNLNNQLKNIGKKKNIPSEIIIIEWI